MSCNQPWSDYIGVAEQSNQTVEVILVGATGLPDIARTLLKQNRIKPDVVLPY